MELIKLSQLIDNTHIFDIFEITQNTGFKNFSNVEIKDINSCKNYLYWLIKNSDYYGIKLNGKIIGIVGYHSVNYIAYILNDKYQKQGYLSKVFPIFLDYGFQICNEILASIIKENEKSIHFIQKFGFELFKETPERYIYKKSR